MGRGRGFTTSSAQRIAKAVRRVEGLLRTLTSKPLPKRGPVPFLFRRFELKEDLAEDDHATAHPMFFDYDEEDWEADYDESLEFEVYDFIREWSGSAGARGYAIKMHDFEHWEVLVMECP